MATVERPVDFGGTLKRLREARCVALRDVADATKISVSALEALERNDISRLPGGIFRRGIIRAYAATIAADPEQLVRDFDAQFARDGSTARFGRGPAGSTGRGSIVRPAMAIGAAVLLLIAAIVAWFLFARV